MGVGQDSSSELSKQSSFPLHFKFCGMHLPDLHVKELGLQVVPIRKDICTIEFIFRIYYDINNLSLNVKKGSKFSACISSD